MMRRSRQWKRHSTTAVGALVALGVVAAEKVVLAAVFGGEGNGEGGCAARLADGGGGLAAVGGSSVAWPELTEAAAGARGEAEGARELGRKRRRGARGSLL